MGTHVEVGRSGHTLRLETELEDAQFVEIDSLALQQLLTQTDFHLQEYTTDGSL